MTADLFASVLAHENILTTPQSMAPFLKEWRGAYTSTADAVLLPTSTEEVAACMRVCHEHAIAVVPQGGNTGLVGGSVANGGMILSLKNMNRIRALSEPDRVITVEAGCTLAEVRAAAEQQNLLFPVHIASADQCCIGGCLATNAGGLSALRYGSMRAVTLGLEVVLANGDILNTLTNLRKDNSGLDVSNLFIGSEGTLGIITAASLRLVPEMRTRIIALVVAETLSDLQNGFHRLQQHAFEWLTAFEMMPRFALELVQKHMYPNKDIPIAKENPECDWFALVQLESSTDSQRIYKLFDQALKNAELGFLEEGNPYFYKNEKFWNWRENIPKAQTLEGMSFKHDISLSQETFVEAMEEMMRACLAVHKKVRLCPFGHMGDGNVHFNITIPEGMSDEDFETLRAPLREAVHGVVKKYKGSIAAEHGVGLLKRDEANAYRDPTHTSLMRTLKATLDSKGILNPGKLM
jgi:FAD/FMN-containing dehydrogenase